MDMNKALKTAPKKGSKPSTKTKPSAPKTSKTSWLDGVNKVKGWVTISSPTNVILPKTRPETGNTAPDRSSTEDELAELHKEAVKQELKLAKEYGEMMATVESLELKMLTEKRDQEKVRVEHDLKIARKKRDELSNRHDISCELTLKRAKLVKQMHDLDKDIGQSILQTTVETDDILENNKKTRVKKGHKSRKIYDKRREEVEKKIIDLRDNKIRLRAPNDPKAKLYAGLGTEEENLLLAMLQKADALAETNQMEDAIRLLDEVAEKGETFAKARAGVLIAKISPKRNPEISTLVDEAQQYIAAIRVAGLAKLADRLTGQLDTIEIDFELAKAEPLLVLSVEDLAAPITEFVGECKTKADRLGDFRKELQEMFALIGELRLVGDGDIADDATSIWERHDPASDIGLEIRYLQKRNAFLRDIVQDSRDETLKGENLDPEQLRQKMADLKQSVEEMYKHHRDGTRKTQTDATTQKTKDVSKDNKIKREALDELNLRMKMAEMLVESNSIEGMKRAEALLNDVTEFQTDLKENSDNYELIEKGIEELKSDFKLFEDRYRPYLIDRRSELKILTDAFAKDYKKQNPKTNTAKLVELWKFSADLRLEVRQLKEVRKVFNTKAESVDDAIKEFGTLLGNVKPKLTLDGKSVKGYWGKLATDLAEARKTADKSDKDSLTSAIVAVDKIAADLKGQMAIIQKLIKNKGDFMDLTPEERGQFTQIRQDVFTGQDKHDANEAAKKQWQKDYKVLKKLLETIQAEFKRLKMDLTDIDLALLELDAHKTEQSAQSNYVEGIETLKDMTSTANALDNRAKQLATFKADPVDKVTKATCDHLRAFRSFVDQFENEVRASDPDVDDKYDLSNLGKFLELVRDTVPDAAITRLENKGLELSKKTKLSAESRELRESALADVRLIMGRLRTSAAIKHFTTQTFADDDTLEIALAALDRLQIKLLTALK